MSYSNEKQNQTLPLSAFCATTFLVGEEFVAVLSVVGDVFSGSEDVGCSIRELEVSTVEVFLTACSPFEEYFRGVIDK